MLYPNTNKKFLDYFFHRQNWIIVFSCVIPLIAGIYLFLLSYQGGRYLDTLPFFSKKNTAQIIHLAQAGYWTSPTDVTIQWHLEDAFTINQQEKQLLVDWISNQYPVDSEAIELFVSAAYLTAHEIGLDPHLILAVMAIESSFNPEAESPVGAQGLMQVMTKVHSKRFEPHGGIKAAKDPVTNIRVGSAILKEYVSRGGSVERGLKSYVGAAAYPHDFGYGAKVLAEYHRFKLISSGKKIPMTIASKSSPKKLVRAQTDKSRVKAILSAPADDPANT
ncbi:MAG: transglycosylase SLT domain-containing protein [Betaproteobacteria bacterium]|nr:transglycosylase SLT domain-containing protein [Betaproteobacteria bacterium]